MSKEAMNVRIDSLGINTRMVNALALNGFHTLGDVARAGVSRLLGPGIGPMTARVIRFSLNFYGIEHDIPARLKKIYR